MGRINQVSSIYATASHSYGLGLSKTVVSDARIVNGSHHQGSSVQVVVNSTVYDICRGFDEPGSRSIGCPHRLSKGPIPLYPYHTSKESDQSKAP